ncbi:MAG: TolC family protein [Chitinophagales bacterium]|nr:TolC family protein [Chitinophagales bacterium]MDW8274138.1 TolC family protein [Chitinophagales bacterium]
MLNFLLEIISSVQYTIAHPSGENLMVQMFFASGNTLLLRIVSGKVNIFIWILVLCGWGLHAQQWTLERCIDHALKNNINVKQAGLQKQVMQKQLTQSYLNTFLPNIDANANYTFSVGNSVNQFNFSIIEGRLQTLTGNIQASMPIFTGLQQIYGIQRSKQEMLAASFDEADVKNNIIMAVLTGFLNVIMAGEMVKIAEKQLKLVGEQLEITEKRVRNGLLPEAAILEAKAQKARSEVELVNAKTQYDMTVVNMKNLLMINDESGFDVVVPEVSPEKYYSDTTASQSALIKNTLAIHPAVKAAEARAKSALYTLKMSRSAFSPSIAVFASLGSNFSDQNKRPTRYDTTYVGGIFPQPVPKDFRLVPFGEQLNQTLRKMAGITFSLPIISKGQRIINEQISRVQLQARQLEIENRKNQVRQQVIEMHANTRAAYESYLASIASAEAARQAFAAIQSRFENGLAPALELERARANMLIAESQLAQAKYTFIFRQKMLDALQGRKISLE